MGANDREPYVVVSLLRALLVLGDVVGKGRVVTLAEVVQDSKLPKSTIYRYLRTFVASGYLDYDRATDMYSVGLPFLTVASAAIARGRLRESARPEIERLADLFGHTANLGVLERGGIVYLDIVKTHRHPEVKARIGVSHPVHSTSLGKAIMAYLPAQERTGLLRQPLDEQTARTISKHTTLERELAYITARGYATDIEENEPDAMCVGVPILSPNGYPVAAMSLTMRTRRHAAAHLESTIKELQRSAASVSAALERSSD